MVTNISQKKKLIAQSYTSYKEPFKSLLDSKEKTKSVHYIKKTTLAPLVVMHLIIGRSKKKNDMKTYFSEKK